MMNSRSPCLQLSECVCVLVPLRPLQHWVCVCPVLARHCVSQVVPHCVCPVSARHCVSRVVPHCVCVFFQEWRTKFYRGGLVFYACAPHLFWCPQWGLCLQVPLDLTLSIFRRTGTGKNSILKKHKKKGAGPFFAGLSAKLFGLLSHVCQCVDLWDVSHSYGHKNHSRGYKIGIR